MTRTRHSAVLLWSILLAWLSLGGAIVYAQEPKASTPTGPEEPNTNDADVPAAHATNTPAGRVESTNAPPRLDYASFRIISERNIFNANRSSRSGRGRRDQSRPVKVETFSLVGTMSYAKGDVAFFDGSSSQFRKAFKPQDTIAGYKIVCVTPNSVNLEKDGKTMEFAVGAQMKRQDEGPWELMASRLHPTSEAKSNDSSPDDASGADNDVLKRLLQKREEEINK